MLEICIFNTILSVLIVMVICLNRQSTIIWDQFSKIQMFYYFDMSPLLVYIYLKMYQPLFKKKLTLLFSQPGLVRGVLIIPLAWFSQEGYLLFPSLVQSWEGDTFYFACLVQSGEILIISQPGLVSEDTYVPCLDQSGSVLIFFLAWFNEQGILDLACII